MTELFFDNKKYISSKETAELLSYTPEQITKLARAGEIRGRKIKNRWYFEESIILSLKGDVIEEKESTYSPQFKYVIGIIIIIIAITSFHVFAPRMIVNHLISDIPEVSTDTINENIINSLPQMFLHEVNDISNSAISARSFISNVSFNLKEILSTARLVFSNLKNNYISGYRLVRETAEININKVEGVYNQTANTLGSVKDYSEVVADSVYCMFSPMFGKNDCRN